VESRFRVRRPGCGRRSQVGISPTTSAGFRLVDEAIISIRGKKDWLWYAVDQDGFVINVLVQSRRNAKAAKRMMREFLKGQGRKLRVRITDNLQRYDAAK